MLAAWVDPMRRRARWLGGVGLLLLLALYFWRDPISQRLLPDPRMNQQLERAQMALARGQLSTADGRGARELFESVLAADPDQMIARQGLVDVRNAAIARARLGLQQHRLAQVRKNLALAESLSAPIVQLQPLQAQLRDLELASGDISALLAQAQAAGVADESALVLYNRVLQLDADNEIAAQARSELLARWLIRADDLLAGEQVLAAQQLIARVVAADPAHLDLPALQAKLGEAVARAQRQQARLLELALADEQAGRIHRAADKYRQLDGTGSESIAAQAALHRLAVRMALQAQRLAADFQFRRAEAALAKARSWSPQATEIASAERHVAQSRLSRKRLLVKPSRVDRARVPQLILEAEQAMARGDFITSPGSSAWDKLRVARAIAPDSSQVLKLQREFGQGSRACFEQAMTDNQLKRAQSCLEANLAQQPAAATANAARRRLADRWLAYAEERIAASDFAEAEKALASARHWQPSHPMLKATAARLQLARGGSR